MKDRRNCCRWQINWQGQIGFADKDNLTPCHISDINFKGIRVCLNETLDRDTYLSLNIFLAGECCLQVEAWVAWHKVVEGRNHYGLLFSRITNADKEKIYAFIRRNFQQQINRQWWQASAAEKGGEDMDDRRIFERLSVRLPLRFINPGENKEGKAVTRDISAKGIGMVLNEELAPFTPLEVWLNVPDKGEPIYARGEVVWSKKAGADKYMAGVDLQKADLMGVSRVLRTI